MIGQAILVVVVVAGAAAARRAGRFGFSVFACVILAVFVYTLSLPFSSSLVFFTQKSSNQRKRETRAASSSLDTLSASISCTRRILAKLFVRV